VIIANGFCATVAERYIESHPVTGLVLVKPVNAKQAGMTELKELTSIKKSIDECTYEPQFPILLIRSKDVKTSLPHRLQGDASIDEVVLDQGDNDTGYVNGKTWGPAYQSTANWLDDMGM
jgi:hypothetical protein